MKDENLFFVGIRDQLQVRKDLLTNSKTLLGSLKQYESFVQVREEKAKHIKELQIVFDDLLELNKKLRNQMPKFPFKQDINFSEPRPLLPKKLEVLDDELARIEKRLSSLG